MPKVVERFIRRTVRLCPLVLAQQFVRRRLISVFYHLVSANPLPHVRHLFPFKSPAQFETDLLYLKQRFNVITYETLLSCRSDLSRLPNRSLLLTFDDGFAECYALVRPLLLKHRLSAVFFVATDFVDNRRMFYRNKVSLCIDAAYAAEDPSWTQMIPVLKDISGVSFRSRESFARWLKLADVDDEDTIDAVCCLLGVDVRRFLDENRPYLTTEQLTSLVADGFTIGAHSKSHRRLNYASPDIIAEEIIGSSRCVQQWTGQAHVPFAFPFTAGNLDRDHLAAILDEHSFITHLFGTDGLRLDRPFLLNRLWLDDPPNASPASSIPSTLRQAYIDSLTNSVFSRSIPTSS